MDVATVDVRIRYRCSNLPSTVPDFSPTQGGQAGFSTPASCRATGRQLTLGQALDSRPRVSLVVGALNSFGGHVRVNLRGGEVRVAKQFLYASQIRPRIKHVCRVAVSQLVRCECRVQLAGVEVFF